MVIFYILVQAVFFHNQPRFSITGRISISGKSILSTPIYKLFLLILYQYFQTLFFFSSFVLAIYHCFFYNRIKSLIKAITAHRARLERRKP